MCVWFLGCCSGSLSDPSRWCCWTNRASTNNDIHFQSRQLNSSPPLTRSLCARMRWCYSRRRGRPVNHRTLLCNHSLSQSLNRMTVWTLLVLYTMVCVFMCGWLSACVCVFARVWYGADLFLIPQLHLSPCFILNINIFTSKYVLLFCTKKPFYCMNYRSFTCLIFMSPPR